MLNQYNHCLYYLTEPGYYEDGSFGIRIENVMRSIPATVEVRDNSRNHYLTEPAFEHFLLG